MTVIKFLQKTIYLIARSLITTAVVMGLIIGYAARIEPNWIEEKAQPVSIAELPTAFEGFRIVQLSDLHGKLFTDRELVQRVNKLNPDMVVITGDVFDEYQEVPVDYADTALGGIKARYGIYYVYGNNDLYLGKAKIKQAMAALNIKTLEDEKVPIRVKGQSIYLAGVDYPRVRKIDLAALVSGIGKAPKILLAHRPEIIDPAVKAGIDLVLVGHTHGGQIRSPYMPKFVTIVKKGYEKYKSGLFNIRGTQMYVNRGLGISDTPLRFLTRPEITVITLHKQ